MSSIYTVNLALIALWWCFQYVVRRGRNFFIVFTTIQLTLLLGLRDAGTMGFDLFRYERYFEQIGGLSLFETISTMNTEGMFGGGTILFYPLMWLVQQFGVSFQLFIFLVSAFYIGSFMYLVSKESRNPLLSVLVFLSMGPFTFSFSCVKQSVAMAFMMLSVVAYDDNKPIKSMILLALGVCFHTTIVVCLPIILLERRKMTQVMLAGYVSVLALALVFRIEIGRFLVQIFREGYVDSYHSHGSLTGNAIIFGLIALVFILVNTNTDRLRQGGETVRQGHILLSIAVIQILASYSYVFTRLNYNLIPLFAIAVANMLQDSQFRARFGKWGDVWRLAILVVLIAILVPRYYRMISSEQVIADYVFFWQI